jgi:hypothetical protein
LPPQDPLPFQPKIIQFVKTGIPPQVIIYTSSNKSFFFHRRPDVLWSWF